MIFFHPLDKHDPPVPSHKEIEDPAYDADEEGAEEGGAEGFDGETGDHGGDKLEHRGIDHEGKQSQCQDVDGESEDQRHRPDHGIDDAQNGGSEQSRRDTLNPDPVYQNARGCQSKQVNGPPQKKTGHVTHPLGQK